MTERLSAPLAPPHRLYGCRLLPVDWVSAIGGFFGAVNAPLAAWPGRAAS